MTARRNAGETTKRAHRTRTRREEADATSAPIIQDAGNAGADNQPGSMLLASWTLNPVQAAFVASTARFSFYVGGIGAGKTTAGALRALDYALDHPGALGLIGAPTYPMLRDATQRTVFDLLEALSAHDEDEDAHPARYTYRKAENHLTLPNGAEILFRSLDEPDRVRGLNLAWFWLDEAPMCGYYAWQVLKGRLRQRSYPTTAWATGTPRGRDGFWRDFEHTPRPHHALYRASTLENGHNLPPDYVADLGLSGPLYDQEVLGLFTAFEGLVYPFSADAQNGHLRQSATDAHFAQVIGGVDWGYTNPTAAVVFGLDRDERAWQLDELYQRRAPLDAVIVPALIELTRRYSVRAWYCGPDEPEHIAVLQAALAREGLPTRALPAENAIRPGIQTVLRMLAPRGDGTRGLYVAPRCVHTIAEYGSYQYPTTPLAAGLASAAGQSDSPPAVYSRASADLPELPVKANDHLMDATRYALHTALARTRATEAWLDLHLRGRLAGREAPPPRHEES
jgi:phage terminase large subunit-like protein